MPGSDEGWLVSGSTDPDEVRTFYDVWAQQYDADLAAWDYRAPARIARLLADRADLAAPVLDAGCGTGLSGRALREAGFVGELSGVDVSEESLPIAAASGAYDRVSVANLNERLPFEDGAFATVACVGVLTYVPDVRACWRDWCRITRSGGVIGFTQREDMWLARDCHQVVEDLAADGLWTPMVVTEPEPYLPESDELADIGVHHVVVRVC